MTQRSPQPETLELLLRETHHRCNNDLQMVVSLLSLQANRCRAKEAKSRLRQAADRVAVLARARTAMLYETHTELQDALGYVCEALASQAEPRSFSVALHCEDGCDGLGQGDITTVALVVNELATNAIKHAFQTGQDGHVTISANGDDRQLLVIVDDDGLPFPEASDGHGLGLELIRRLIASVDGVFIMPQSKTKRFEIRVPKADHGSAESSELADAAWDCR